MEALQVALEKVEFKVVDADGKFVGIISKPPQSGQLVFAPNQALGMDMERMNSIGHILKKTQQEFNKKFGKLMSQAEINKMVKT